jgi:hypothetical protein
MAEKIALDQLSYIIVPPLQRSDDLQSLDTEPEPMHNLTLVNNPLKVHVRHHQLPKLVETSSQDLLIHASFHCIKQAHQDYVEWLLNVATFLE